MTPILFQTINWENVTSFEYPGERGVASWKTVQYDNLRVRIVEYSSDYVANHWCRKGHIVFCIEGELQSELSDGRTFTLLPGMSYVVTDNTSLHRSRSKNGVKLLIIDGTFLHYKPELNPWKM